MGWGWEIPTAYKNRHSKERKIRIHQSESRAGTRTGVLSPFGQGGKIRTLWTQNSNADRANAWETQQHSFTAGATATRGRAKTTPFRNITEQHTEFPAHLRGVDSCGLGQREVPTLVNTVMNLGDHTDF